MKFRVSKLDIFVACIITSCVLWAIVLLPALAK